MPEPWPDYPTHDEIEACRGGGLVPDVFVDFMHRERDRYDAAAASMGRLLAGAPAEGDTVTFYIVRGDDG
jgi:hypothetical protein